MAVDVKHCSHINTFNSNQGLLHLICPLRQNILFQSQFFRSVFSYFPDCLSFAYKLFTQIRLMLTIRFLWLVQMKISNNDMNLCSFMKHLCLTLFNFAPWPCSWFSLGWIRGLLRFMSGLTLREDKREMVVVGNKVFLTFEASFHIHPLSVSRLSSFPPTDSLPPPLHLFLTLFFHQILSYSPFQ